MTDAVYERLAEVLDTLPNGFPRTEDGLEMRILKRIFRPEDAELFCDLRLQLETPEQIAERTGRPLEGLAKQLTEMWKRGQVFGLYIKGKKMFRMAPWVIGIYELQLPHMDRELAEMCEEYMKVYGKEFFKETPQLMQVIPIEREIPATHETLPYQKVSGIIEKGQSFMVQDCICRKEQGVLGNPCDKPLRVCLSVAPVPGVFKETKVGRPINKTEAYEVLEISEKAGLVHMTWNVQDGHFFICNCCGCCCGVLRGITDLGIPASRVVNSYYYAKIDPEACVGCGTCKDERCQVDAIVEGEEFYRVVTDRCIGCGLCVTTCPSEAIRLVPRSPEDVETPPVNEAAWYEERARKRGVDYSAYK